MPQQLGQNKFLENALKYGFSLFGIPKTGQTIKDRTGDDGDLRKGYPRTLPRFVDNGDGTITDNATGLMWVQDPYQIGGVWAAAGNPTSMTWNNAIDNCLALNYAGHTDWRLPNRIELISIVDLGRYSPAIDTTFFVGARSSWYWTSTALKNVPAWKWYVDFLNGNSERRHNSESRYPRPVRLGVN